MALVCKTRSSRGLCWRCPICEQFPGLLQPELHQIGVWGSAVGCPKRPGELESVGGAGGLRHGISAVIGGGVLVQKLAGSARHMKGADLCPPSLQCAIATTVPESIAEDIKKRYAETFKL
jgi:hypothetical protein